MVIPVVKVYFDSIRSINQPIQYLEEMEEREKEIYKAATAAKIAPTAAMKDPVKAGALLAGTLVLVEVGLGVPVLITEPLDDGDVPVAMTVDWIVVGTIGIPPPWDGESPPPDDTGALVDSAGEDESDESAVEDGLDSDPDPDPEPDPDVEVGLTLAEADFDAEAEVEEGVDDLEDDDTSLQDKSNNGLVLKVDPTIPKLGEGIVGSESWRVNHHVLTFPKRGHPTSSQ